MKEHCSCRSMIMNVIELRKNGWTAKTSQESSVSPSLPSGHWDCPTCCVSNRNADGQCVCCQETKLVSFRFFRFPYILGVCRHHANEILLQSSVGIPTFGLPSEFPALPVGAFREDALMVIPDWNCLFCSASNSAADAMCQYCGESKPVSS